MTIVELKDDNLFYESKRIVVIEDDRHTRQIICRLLREVGFRMIYEGDDGDSGFREIVRIKPDVVLCDIYMKPVDGMTFLKTLRQLKRKEIAELPVIFLTGDANIDTVRNARDLKVDGYLVKPVSRSALKESLDRILRPQGEPLGRLE